jgi:hypothetical protein
MRPSGFLPARIQRDKITRVEGEDRSTILGRVDELGFVRKLLIRSTGLCAAQDIVPALTKALREAPGDHLIGEEADT